MTLRTLEKNYFGELEIIKALSIMGLPFVHFIEEAGYECEYIIGYNVRFFDSVIFLTVFGPAIFMMCMGARIRKDYSSKRLIVNGVQFLIIGYLLNFVCFTMPQLLYVLKYGEIMYYGDNLIDVAFQDCFGGDIYIFVGWFYLFYGILKKYFRNISSFHMLCISAFLLVCNNFSGHLVELPYTVGTQILGNFITVNDQSYFPLAGWCIFPIAGMIMRDYLSANNFTSYHHRMNQLLILGVGGLWLFSCSLVVYGIRTFDILLNFTQNYTMDIFTAFTLLLLSLGVIGIVSKIYYAVRENALERSLTKLSAFIMAYYIFQWMLVSLVTYYCFFLFFDEVIGITIPLAIAIMLLIWGISLILTMNYGYTFLQFILRKTDYTRWFKNKSVKKAA